MHNYSLRGCNRESYLFVLAVVAIGIVGVAKQTAGYFGVAISITAFSAFGGVFFVFDRWLWKTPLVSKLTYTPDLSGIWTIEGRTDGADSVSRNWHGTVTIEQTWSKIAICIETEQARSRSTMASLERDPGFGYRLLYAYSNLRKDVDCELKSHNGFCEVVIAADVLSAQASYFNDHQRRTAGTMMWSRQLSIKEKVS